MYTSSAEPARLETYGTSVQPVADEISSAALKLEAALGAFLDGAGTFAPTTTASDWVGPLRQLHDELAYLGAWTAKVGGWFREAAVDPDGDGVFGTNDELALSLAVGSPILAVERRRVAAELASLHERARLGELDLDSAEIASLVSRARTLVDASADPQAEAEALIAAMGPGDVVTALTILESGDLDDPPTFDMSVTAMHDLGHVLSLGLESQPERAERWADDLVTLKVTQGSVLDPGRSTESIAIMGSGNAAGMSVLTGAIYGQLVTRTGPTPRGGIVDRLYGVTDPAAPILVTAATVDDHGQHPQAPLAHDVVRRTLDAGMLSDVFDRDDGSQLFDVESSTTYQTHLGEVLVAAVDHTLPSTDRVNLSYDLTSAYVDLRSTPMIDADGVLSPAVTRGLAAATQPLLENWVSLGSDEVASAPGSIGSATEEGVVLDQALRYFADAPGGVDGINQALQGTITARLVEYHDPDRAAEVGAVGPFVPTNLEALGSLHLHVASAIGQDRFASIVKAVERDTRLQDGTLAVVSGILGEAPGGSAAAGVVQALVVAESSPDVIDGGNPIDGLETHLTRDLVAHNLATIPEFSRDPALGALIEDVIQEEGEVGLFVLMHGERHARSDEGGLALSHLREVVGEQERLVGLDVAAALGDMHNPSRVEPGD